MISFTQVGYVALGGMLGCVLRYLAVFAAMRINPSHFPIGTMLVNIVGSFLIGMLMAKYGESETARLFLVTGILGGFTTFSAFSWDILQLMQRGQLAAAGMYVMGSVGLSLAAVIIGFQAGK